MKAGELALALARANALSPRMGIPRLMALLILGEDRVPMAMKELIDRLGIGPVAMTQTLDRLEGDGLVVRGPSPDNRQKTVMTTQAGAAFIRKVLGSS